MIVPVMVCDYLRFVTNEYELIQLCVIHNDNIIAEGKEDDNKLASRMHNRIEDGG